MRISVTTVEQFRLVMETDWAQESELVDLVRGKRTETWQMKAGTAFHELLSLPDAEGFGDEIQEGDYIFKNCHLQAARRHMGSGAREVKANRTLSIAGKEITLVGQADLINGLLVHDAKVKFSSVDHRNYENSLQWRMYLWIFEAVAFQYDCFDFLDPKESYCQLKDIISFKFWPYVGMGSDCEFWVREFILWAQSRGLTKYLDRQSSTPEAA